MESFIFRATTALLAFAALALNALAWSEALAQTVYYCSQSGKRIITDTPCEKMGMNTKRIRDSSDFQGRTGLGGLTDGEKRMAAEAKQQDQVREAEWQQNKMAEAAEREHSERINDSVCRNLDAEKKQVVAQLRANSTQWLNDRHRKINDEMYRRRCKTL